MSEKPPKLSSRSELEAKSRELKAISDKGQTYFGRESFDRKDDVISKIHGVPFIEKLIPDLIKKRNGAQVRILDVGAGAGFFTEQIRNTFGNKVKVFSTGLSRDNAQYFRDKYAKEGPSPIHKDDLKWKSVVELSDFEEFDLIVDSFGEFTYMIEGVYGKNEEIFKKIEKYLTVIARKLKPGGIAYIAPADGIGSLPQFKHLQREIELIYGIKIDFPSSETETMRIIKKEN
jgi:SAM-dependent methyltransferase